MVNGIELSLNFERKLKRYPYKKIDNNTLNSKKISVMISKMNGSYSKQDQKKSREYQCLEKTYTHYIILSFVQSQAVHITIEN